MASSSLLLSLAALLVLSSFSFSGATREGFDTDFSVRIVSQTNTTTFLGDYPNEIGSARVVNANFYDFATNKFLGNGNGKCTVVRSPHGSGRYVENCVLSFDYGPQKGQIIVLGDLNNTVDPLEAPPNFSAVSGGTREFLKAFGQVKREVVPPEENAFRLLGETLEIKYTFMINIRRD